MLSGGLLGKTYDFSESQFPHLQNRNNSIPYKFLQCQARARDVDLMARGQVED